MNSFSLPHEFSSHVIPQDVTTRRGLRPPENLAPRTPKASRPPAWRARAIDEFARVLPSRRAGLKAHLTDRLLALTGQVVPSKSVYVDDDGRMAVTTHDDVIFRLDARGHLALLRPCAYCGTGQFESPEIDGSERLGYALGSWKPLHPACGDESSEDAAGLSG